MVFFSLKTVYIIFFCIFVVNNIKLRNMNYKMISLYDRLKPHYKELIQIKNTSQPDLVSCVVESLEKECFVGDLKYSSIINLGYLFGNMNPFIYFENL